MVIFGETSILDKTQVDNLVKTALITQLLIDFLGDSRLSKRMIFSVPRTIAT